MKTYRRCGSLAGALVLLAALALPEAERAAAAPDGAGEGVEEWVVVLTDPRPARRRGWAAGVGYTGSVQYEDDPTLQRLARDIERAHEVSLVEQWPIRSLGVHCLKVRFTGDKEAVLSALRADKRVEWVQPLNMFEGSGSTRSVATPDPYFDLQSSLKLLNVTALSPRLTGAGVKLGIIDSAVEPDHPDLSEALREQRDFVDAGEDPVAERHGTGIAGVLVAADSIGIGIAGVAPGAALHAYRACWETDTGHTRCDSLTLSRALDHAAQKPPDVLNLSLTGPQDRLLDRLLDRVLIQGVVVVVAYDESRLPEARFPSPRPGVVIARSGSRIRHITDNSVYAPGEEVLTAQPGHSYDFMSGHSLAAAHISGVLALLLEASPDLSAAGASASLGGSIRRQGDVTSVDACAAVQRVDPSVICR